MITEFFQGPINPGMGRHHEVEAQQAAGLEVVQCRNERLRLEFFDVGAVFLLRKVIWTVTDFTVDRFRDRLRDLWCSRRSDVEIRELIAGGADELVALFAAVLPDSPTALVATLDEPEAFLREPSSFVLGAYVDDAPVGLAWGLQMRSPGGRLTTYLHQLDVHESWKRQGVGSALVTEAMNLARGTGSTKFWLSTGGHNEAAQALYESLGGDRKPLGDVNYWWDLE